MADVLAEAARAPTVYLVPGSPVVAERTVQLLAERAPAAGLTMETLPALSFAEVAWARLGVDPMATGARVVDGRAFAEDAADPTALTGGPLLIAQCDTRDVLSDVKLSIDTDTPPTVTVLQRLGLPDEHIEVVDWNDLDRVVTPDHLTSLFVDGLRSGPLAELSRFADLVRTLRRECPWDRDQTHASLTRHLVEETYEVIEAIDGYDPDRGDGAALLNEELGDLLFQVFFHATLGAETGRFDLATVARTVHDKLVLRHPHVFVPDEVSAASPDEVVANWEEIKRVEKGRTSVFDGIPTGLPALLRAVKVLRKADAAALGDAGSGGSPVKAIEHVAASLDRAAREVPVDDIAVGELLWAVCAVAREGTRRPRRGAADRRPSAASTGTAGPNQ